jgi:alpha-tubulin suppressor-like RCC1 family protein
VRRAVYTSKEGKKMKRSWRVEWLICLAILAIAASLAHGQSTESIIGWGQQVVVEQAALDGLIAVAAGAHHSLGLRSDGKIVAWGNNDYGQCNVPALNEDFIAVAGGDFHSLGLTSDGSIVAWGRNLAGQCNVPAPNEDFIAVAGGGDHSLGLKSNGTIVGWGSNNYGQCNAPPAE